MQKIKKYQYILQKMMILHFFLTFFAEIALPKSRLFHCWK
jgi:hypothetical protein